MENATVSVTYGNHTHVFSLDGFELSTSEQADGRLHRYLTNASKAYVCDEVEKALLLVVPEPPNPREEQIDSLMQAMYDSRTQRMRPTTAEEWKKAKANPVHRASLRVLRKEAVQMIEDGELE
jgi:hypothetical protein